MSSRTPPRPLPRSVLDDGARDLRVERARAELQRRGILRATTEHDAGVRRDASGRAVERVVHPSPRGGVAVVGYRRGLPGDSTSDDEHPRRRRPDGSYSGEDTTGPTVSHASDDEIAPELALDEPTEGTAPRVGGGPRLTWAAITEAGADPVRLVGQHVRVYLDRTHLACLVGVLVALSILAGIGIASIAVGLAVLRSHA